MAILDIDGLLGGKRLRKCSGEARWHYGYYLLLANGYARIELDFEAIAEHFISFRDTAPTAESVQRDFVEYQANHLIFVYSFSGRTWAQFDTKRSNTKNHKTAVDRRSPHPQEAGYQIWLKEQHPDDWGLYHWSSNPNDVSETETPQIQQVIKSSENLGKVLNISEDLPRGVGVGLGVGEGDGKKRRSKPSAAPSACGPEVSKSLAQTRHSRIQEMIFSAYREQNSVDPPWDGGEGNQLKALLSATPGWQDGQLAQCLANMYASAGFAKGTRPREFLPRLPKYLNGPLNEFNREQSNGSGNSKGDRRAADISKTTREVFGGGGIVHGNDPTRLQVKAASAGVGTVAGNPQGLLVSGIQPGDDPPDKQPTKV